MINGGQIQSKESFLYGRFETMVLPAFGSGVVSSFFLFSDVPGFQNNWNEIDFEFLGRNTNAIDTNVIQTKGGRTDKNINIAQKILPERASAIFWKLCIEWQPGIITWKINDVVIRSAKISISTPMKLMANIWVGNPGWAGEFNPLIIPQSATYLYFRYSAFINDGFLFKWQDSLDSIDKAKWYLPTHSTPLTSFKEENVIPQKSNLILKLTN